MHESFGNSPSPATTHHEKSFLDPFPLAKLSPGESAVVYAIQNEDGIRRRLLDLGLTVRTRISCVGKSPAGDPAAYRIRGAVIALRQADSRAILVTYPQREDSVWD